MRRSDNLRPKRKEMAVMKLLLLAALIFGCAAIPKPKDIPSTTDSTKGAGAKSSSAYPPGFPTPTEDYPTFAQLDHNGDYFLFWRTNSTHIQFETHVKTKGYVGFGISHHGSMYPADVVIGWVKDGHVHFKDRHTIGFYEPIIDKSQDWELLAGFEDDFGTVLKFSRAIDTCDEKDDLAIEHGTTKVIYSYHPDDPEHETGLPYHGSGRRGAKSLLLLDKVSSANSLPADAKHFDFVNKKFHVPAQDTFYHCTVYKLPELKQKHHMIMYEPVLQKGNEGIVHHMLVYMCPTKLDPKWEGVDFQCYHSQTARQPELRACTSVLLAWAVGGEPFYFPKDVGFSLGDHGDATHVLLETHYNNPAMTPGYVDSSGLRIHFTPTLREHDAGMLMTGVMIDHLQIIPPEYQSFMSRGHCSKACTNKHLSQVPNQEVNVFANFLHTHLLGSGIKTRLIRNGTELEPILVDNYYDFDYQEVRMLPKMRTLRAGDSIVTECDYKSFGKKGMTRGGFSTHDEMCLSFLLYYPRLPMSTCMSIPLYNMYTTNPHEKTALKDYLMQMDWTNQTVRDTFQKNTDESVYSLACTGRGGPSDYFGTMAQTDPVHTPYVKPKSGVCLN